MVGSVWTWVAMDPDTKLIVSWWVGNRDLLSAQVFMTDLASRLNDRVQLSTDGLKAYEYAIKHAFNDNVDYGQLYKLYEGGNPELIDQGYSRYIGAERKSISGKPDFLKITTSHVERQNLTMRMSMRRFARRTNAFSKKIQNHVYSVALHFVYYNFCRIHKTIRVTPAMEAGIADDILEIEDLVKLRTKEHF